MSHIEQTGGGALHADMLFLDLADLLFSNRIT